MMGGEVGMDLDRSLKQLVEAASSWRFLVQHLLGLHLWCLELPRGQRESLGPKGDLHGTSGR